MDGMLYTAHREAFRTAPPCAPQVVRKPSVNAMAALLGLALGVMATVSCVELVARSAMSGKGDAFLVLTAALGGALTYYVLEPMFPKVDDHHDHVKVCFTSINRTELVSSVIARGGPVS